MDENEEATGSLETGKADAGQTAESGSLTADDMIAALAGLEGEKHDPDAAEEGEEKTAEPEKGKVVFSPEQQRILEERIGKEVAKRKGLEKQMNAIQSELDRQRREKGETSGETPNLYELSPDELAAQEKRVESMLDFLEAHWDGTVDPDHPEKGGHTAEQIRKAHRVYSKLQRELPRAQAAIVARSREDQEVGQEYPAFAPGGERESDYLAFRRMLGPEFAKLPNARRIFVHAVLGEQVEMARRAKATEGHKKRGVDDVPPRLPMGSRSAKKAGSAMDGVGTAGRKKELNLQRLVDSGGDFATAVELLAEIE